MNTNATPYRVPPEPGRWRAFALAMLMHALLLGLLWIGVSWQNTVPVAVEAEIWSPQVKLAAPPPPEPVPAPEPLPEPKPAPAPPPPPAVEPEPEAKVPDPEIALEQERKRKQALEKKLAEQKARKEAQAKKREEELEKKRLAELEKKKQAEEQKRRQEAAAEEDKRRKAEEEKRKLAEEEKRKQLEEEKRRLAEEEKRRQETQLAEQRARKRREDELKRLQALAGEGTAGEAAKAASPKLDPGYARLIAAKIKSNTILPPLNEIVGNPAVEYAIELLPDGSVRDVRLLRPSGIPAFDQAVRRAIDRAAPFPADPATGRVPASMAILHRPKDQ